MERKINTGTWIIGNVVHKLWKGTVFLEQTPYQRRYGRDSHYRTLTTSVTKTMYIIADLSY